LWSKAPLITGKVYYVKILSQAFGKWCWLEQEYRENVALILFVYPASIHMNRIIAGQFQLNFGLDI